MVFLSGVRTAEGLFAGDPNVRTLTLAGLAHKALLGVERFARRGEPRGNANGELSKSCLGELSKSFLGDNGILSILSALIGESMHAKGLTPAFSLPSDMAMVAALSRERFGGEHGGTCSLVDAFLADLFLGDVPVGVFSSCTSLTLDLVPRPPFLTGKGITAWF